MLWQFARRRRRMGRGGRLSSPGGRPQCQAGHWHLQHECGKGREGLPMSPAKPPQRESRGIWGSLPPQGGLGDALLVSLSIAVELGGCWHPGIPLPLPVGPVGTLCPAPGWNLSPESGEGWGAAPAAPAAGSPLGGSVHPLTFAKRKNSINSSRQIKYK